MTRMQSPCRVILFGLILVTLLTPGCVETPGVPSREASKGSEVAALSTHEDEIRTVLEDQVSAWNEGSIQGFMEGYARTDTLRFASGADVWFGWDETLGRYENSFTDRDLMGSLSFEDLTIDVLTSERALVFGRWHLERSDPIPDAGGLFTLLFAAEGGTWRIIYDHTSSGPPDPQESDTIHQQSNGQSQQ